MAICNDTVSYESYLYVIRLVKSDSEFTYIQLVGFIVPDNNDKVNAVACVVCFIGSHVAISSS